MSAGLMETIANSEGKKALRITREKTTSGFSTPAFDSMAVSLAKEWLEVK